MTRRSRKLAQGIVIACAIAISSTAAPPAAQAATPWWHITSGSRPTYLAPKQEGQIILSLTNLGDASVEGAVSPVTISDELPAGLEKKKIEAIAGFANQAGPVVCSLGAPAKAPTCTFAPEASPFKTATLVPFDAIEVRITVKVKSASTGELNTVTVSGGGAPAASTSHPITVSEEPTPFGVQDYEFGFEEEGGGSATQAGSHPFQLTTTLELNQLGGSENPVTNMLEAEPAELPKDLRFKLPAGFIGNPTVFPRCTLEAFAEHECPPRSALGVAVSTIDEPRAQGLATITAPVYNLEPAAGEPARFGFLPTNETPVFIDTSVRTGGDYGVTATVDNIVQVAGFLDSTVTLWGDPGDPRHNNARGDSCLEFVRHGIGTCEGLGETSPPPFLTMPSFCPGTPLESTVEGQSWQHHSFEPVASSTSTTVDGCNRLPFDASIAVAPDVQSTSSGSGLTVKVHVPQEEALNPIGLAPSDLRTSTVALPSGIVVNPSAADGLESCSLEQIGLSDSSEPSCPDASKVATVEITTPVLPNPLTGAIYIAAQEANPFGSLVAIYLVAKDPVSRVLVKLAGDVTLDPITGQLLTTFENTPQLPFEDLTLHFFGGDRAPLATPSRCGSYATAATFAPWSGGATTRPATSFELTSGPHGTPCPGSIPFSPTMAAGTVNIQAGGFSPITTTFNREDGEQTLQRVQVHTPAGVSGVLSGVPLCSEQQGNEGTCGPQSQIGEPTVSVGVGGHPFTVKGGHVYLTERYAGAPFGLSIVTPAKAGPYDLAKSSPCDCIVVRAKVDVDPLTAALTVTTDESGPYMIPTILKGIPLQIRHVNVTINRPDFTFNPTNCNSLSVTSSLSGTEGGLANLSVPFRVANCANLKFTPKFSVVVSGKTSRLNGTSLVAKLSYPTGSFGNQANIGRVKVELPKQLPSRLETLRKACLASVFETDRSKCPGASVVGHARVTTHVLPVPLEGPVYFVSHGGEEFPSLTMVLQGYGLTVEVVGTTFISKKSITSTTFKAPPDVPFESFELDLPAGQFSALGAVGDLCSSKLVMPTVFNGQNGAEIHQSTKIAVTGCPKPHKKKAGRKTAQPRKH